MSRYDGPMGIFDDYMGCDSGINCEPQQFNCGHIAIVSISETECQCMDCLRKWPKEKDFKSDWPEYDRD